MSRVIYVIYSDDVRSWTSFFKNVVSRERPAKYEFRSSLVTDLLQTSASSIRLDVEDAEVLLVILSPDHLLFLESHPEFSYHGLVHGGQKGVLFLCGSTIEDLEAPGVDFRLRFPCFNNWKRVEHSETNNLMTIINKMEPFSDLTFQLIPSCVRCEGDSTVTVSFSNVIVTKYTKNEVALYISTGNDAAEDEKIEVTTLNDRTVYFKAPERKEGKARVRVLVGGNHVLGTEALVYESSCETICDMMQLYIHAMNHLFSMVLSRSLVSNEDLDALLVNAFTMDQLTDIQPKAFEELFGIFRFNPNLKSCAELPTFLHFANKFGLSKFLKWLENLPDAHLAGSIRNVNGLQSAQVPKFHATGAISSSLSGLNSAPGPSIADSRTADEQRDRDSDDSDDEYLVMDKQLKQRAEKGSGQPAENDNTYSAADGPSVADSRTADDQRDRDSDDSDDEYLVMDKQLKQRGEKGSGHPAEDDDIYTAADELSVAAENRTTDQRDSDDSDDECYLVMDKQLTQRDKKGSGQPVEDDAAPDVAEANDEDFYEICEGQATPEEDKLEILPPKPEPVKPNVAELPKRRGSAAAAVDPLDAGQQKLIDLMNQFKAGELTMEEVTIFFEEWKINNPQKPAPSTTPSSSRAKQVNYEITTPAKYVAPSIGKESRPVPPVPELPSRRPVHGGSYTSDKHSSTASISSLESLRSSTASSYMSRSSGIDVDPLDEELSMQSRRSSGGSTEGGSAAPPPLPARGTGMKPSNKAPTKTPDSSTQGANKHGGSAKEGEKAESRKNKPRQTSTPRY